MIDKAEFCAAGCKAYDSSPLLEKHCRFKPTKNARVPMSNAKLPIDNAKLPIDNADMPIDNAKVPTDIANIPMDKSQTSAYNCSTTIHTQARRKQKAQLKPNECQHSWLLHRAEAVRPQCRPLNDRGRGYRGRGRGQRGKGYQGRNFDPQKARGQGPKKHRQKLKSRGGARGRGRS